MRATHITYVATTPIVNSSAGWKTNENGLGDFLEYSERATHQTMVAVAQGRADVAGQELRRPAVPAEDMMQAFLYRHLVPAQEFLAVLLGKRTAPLPVEIVKGRSRRLVGLLMRSDVMRAYREEMLRTR